MGRDSAIAYRKGAISFVTSVLPQVLRWFSLHIFPRNFIFWTSIKALYFCIDLRKLKSPKFKAYNRCILTSRHYRFSQLSLCSLWGISWSRRSNWWQKRQHSNRIIRSLLVNDFYDLSIGVIPVYKMFFFFLKYQVWLIVKFLLSLRTAFISFFQKRKISITWRLLKHFEFESTILYTNMCV
jgi:hypothetical protein